MKSYKYLNRSESGSASFCLLLSCQDCLQRTLDACNSYKSSSSSSFIFYNPHIRSPTVLSLMVFWEMKKEHWGSSITHILLLDDLQLVICRTRENGVRKWVWSVLTVIDTSRELWMQTTLLLLITHTSGSETNRQLFVEGKKTWSDC